MTRDALYAAIDAALHPSRFFLAGGETLRFEHAVKERCRWELFRGHLLDAAQTRLEREFTSWHVFLNGADEPLLSAKHAAEERCVYAVRALRIRAMEAVEENGVIDTRPVRKWHRELVGRIDLDLALDRTLFQKALERLLLRAVVGASRLPITSLESPLPRFSLGNLCYVPCGLRREEKPGGTGWAKESMRLVESAVALNLAAPDRARVVEFLLRAPPQPALGAVRRRFHRLWQEHWLSGDEFAETMKALFRQVALTPLTGFMSKWLKFIEGLGRREFFGPDLIRRLFGYMLRHLVRHLTAFDLRTFHNRGANYPDALLLDGLLRRLLVFLSEDPQAARQPLLLRAFRMAWIARKELEGLPVPDQPTSPGENLRVLPPPFEPVDEGQLLDPHRRAKRLFANEPADELLTPALRTLLDDAMSALDEPRELQELGMAVFLDRPLGVFKQPGEVDRTPLLSYEAFSQAIARRRLDGLRELGLLSRDRHERLSQSLSTFPLPGIPATELPGGERPGVVVLEDALRASADFLFLRTTRSSLAGFQALYAPLPVRDVALFIRTPRARLRENPRALLTAYDGELRPLLDLAIAGDGPPTYTDFAGVEFLRAGLAVVGTDEVLGPVYEGAVNA